MAGAGEASRPPCSGRSDISKAPRVSVILPVFNGAAYLPQAVASIRRQTLPDFELLAIDDGSTDGTTELLRGFAAEDPRIRLVRQPRLGIVAALNRGLAAAAAPLLARMDADDIASPERLSAQAALLADRPRVALVGSGVTVVDARGRALRQECGPTAAAEIGVALLRHNPIVHPTVMMRREPVIRAGGYRVPFRHCEDYDLWLRLAEHHDLAVIAAPLLRLREHGRQSAWHDLEQRYLSEMAAQVAADLRRRGEPDPFSSDGEPVTRAALRALGVEDGAIATRISARAQDSAREAVRARDAPAARRAILLARHQGLLSRRERLHLFRLRIWSSLGRRRT